MPRLQGTKGVYLRNYDSGNKIYIDGISPENDKWEDAAPYEKEYEHPMLKEYNPPERAALRGHSGGATKTPYTVYRLIKALREGRVTDFDVYDSVTSSAISALTEKSVAEGSKPVEFPDFTRGKWQIRPSFKDL